MNGVLFGDKHSFNDWKLILSSKSIGYPEPKKEEIDVIGSNGTLDLSEFLYGDVVYNNRNLEFIFTLSINSVRKAEWNQLILRITNYLHGKKRKIILDTDDCYYYEGRCKVGDLKTNASTASFKVSCECYPYKIYRYNISGNWKWNEFDFTKSFVYNTIFTIQNTKDVIVTNLRMPAAPTLNCSAQMQVVYDGITYNLQQGNNDVDDIVLKDGNNSMHFIGNGIVEIIFSELGEL